MLTDMPQPDDLSIERIAALDLSTDQLWSLISTGDGWTSWLVDDADVAVVPGGTGTTTEDGVVRQVRVDDVIEGLGINFSWWDGDDPSSASYVQLRIVGLPDGGSQLRIAEQLVGPTQAVSKSAEATISWDVRMLSLWLLALHSTVMA